MPSDAILCYNARCHVFMLILITHKEIWVSAVIMGLIMLKVIMSSDVMLSVVMLMS